MPLVSVKFLAQHFSSQQQAAWKIHSRNKIYVSSIASKVSPSSRALTIEIASLSYPRAGACESLFEFLGRELHDEKLLFLRSDFVTIAGMKKWHCLLRRNEKALFEVRKFSRTRLQRLQTALGKVRESFMQNEWQSFGQALSHCLMSKHPKSTHSTVVPNKTLSTHVNQAISNSIYSSKLISWTSLKSFPSHTSPHPLACLLPWLLIISTCLNLSHLLPPFKMSSLSKCILFRHKNSSQSSSSPSSNNSEGRQWWRMKCWERQKGSHSWRCVRSNDKSQQLEVSKIFELNKC